MRPVNTWRGQRVCGRCSPTHSRLAAMRRTGLGASSLTAAELRLLPLRCSYLSFREIGKRLYLSPNTIKSQSISIYRKLGASSRSEAVHHAQRLGLLGR
jgi:LuxR family transcriptional regulator, maltose regulon positive regulatory protein